MATVSGQNTENKVRVTNSKAEYWAEVAEGYKNQAGSYANNAATSATLAANWANLTGATVDGEEYSAKYYAQETQSIYDEAVSVITETTEASTTAIETLASDSISIIGETTLALKTEAVNTINATASTAIATTESTCTSLVTAATSATEAIKTSVISATTTATEACKTEITNLSDGYITTITSLGISATQAIETTKQAAISTISANVATTNANVDKSSVWAEGTDEQVQALGGTHSAKEWCRYNSTVNQNDVRALQGGANTGEVYTKGDSDSIDSRLSEIKSLAHSTFDRSKFTIVGSPNITDDGIASGFSSGNYLRTSTIDFSKHWEITTKFKANDESSGYLWGIQNGGWFNYNYVGTLHNLQFNFKLSDNSEKSLTTSYLREANVYYTYIVGWTGTSYYTKFYNNNGVLLEEHSIDSTLTLNNTSGYVQQGFGSSGNYTFTGSIDLKQFSITVDGVEVFSGNRTGIDTIKPDDYTVVGTPTITTDGIITSWDNSNKVTYGTITGGGATNYEIHYRLLTPQHTFTSDNSLTEFLRLANSGNTNWALDLYSQSKTGIGFHNAGWIYGTLFNSLPSVDYIDLIIKNNGTNFTVSAYQPDGTLIDSKTSSTSGANLPIESLALFSNNNATFSVGTPLYQIDMNCMKVIINGVLVYQPCLKIPYTESKTGSKIVDSIYRERVNDMAEQFGYANYYTLDEDNGNFTLPQVELYGLINKLSNRADYGNSVTTSDVNGSTNAYTFGHKSLAVIKPATPASTYTISVKQAWGSAYKTVNGYGYMTLLFNDGDTVYTSVSATIDVFKVL